MGVRKVSRLGYRKPLLERLSKLSTRNQNGCIEWTGLTNNKGYGLMKIEGRRIGAHIVSWLEAG